jgi:uncharacterized protein (DUF1499 family)
MAINSIQGTGPWTTRFSRWALYGGISGLILTIGGAFLAGQDIIPKMTGLTCMFGGAVLALIGTIAGLLGVGMNLRNKGGLMKSALIGLLLSGGQAGFMASRAVIGSKVPPIHDITTDLASPPSFATIKLGADNLRGVETIDTWKALHAAAYGDIKPIVSTKAVAAVIADAERLAKERGWAIASVDAEKGIFEATASVSLIKFQDDVVLRVTPTDDGKGSRIDMRSVSRVGISDLGVNAKRIREFLGALSKA